MDEVVTRDAQREWDRECKFRGGNRIQINRKYETGVGNNCFHFDGVNEGLGESGLLEGSEVEAINVIPDYC